MLLGHKAGDLLRAVREVDVLRGARFRDVRVPVGGTTDPARPTELWAELHARMRAFVGRRVADRDAAQDIAQEVLLRLHRHLPQLRDEDRLDALAYSIARNAITDHYRQGAAAREAPVADPAPLSAEPEEGSDASFELRAGLAKCLAPLVDRLGEQQREALRLTDLGPLTQAEAAEQLGLSVPGMKSRVQRARAELGEQLRSCCEVRLDATSGIDAVERVGPCACG